MRRYYLSTAVILSLLAPVASATEVSPSQQIYHWNSNAETYYLLLWENSRSSIRPFL